MYDGLVMRLRDKARLEREYNSTGALEDEAADAIEELQKAVLRLEDESGILDELPMYQQPVGWISTTEKLPEKANHYLVYVKCECDGELVSAWEQVAWFCEKFYWEHVQGDDVFKETVTHWMPLPEPPKEET